MNYSPNYFMKISETIEHPKLWAILTAIGLFLNQYVFHQWGFAIGFMMLFILDTMSGVYVANRLGQFSGIVFRQKLMDKSVAYFTIIIAFSVGTKIMLQNSDFNMIEYLNVPFYSLFIAVEFRSIVVKWYKFKEWPWLGDILKLIDRSKKEAVDEKIEANHRHDDTHE